MKSQNPTQMLNSLVASNPQLKNMLQTASQMAQNPNKEEVIEQLAQQKGCTVDEVKQEARKFGVNI